ncbi:hypothetical protein LCGC14_2036710 [marine sediment metagenome]|uniref:Uncharacterized protein n=1 Tax=marine sediment metagenome TaxID=412755 RepID=A0A0F9HQ75_9ZZZZ
MCPRNCHLCERPILEHDDFTVDSKDGPAHLACLFVALSDVLQEIRELLTAPRSMPLQPKPEQNKGTPQ